MKYFFEKNIKKQLQKQKIVIQYKYPKMNQEENKMAYKISDDCVACGACVEACPMGCITEGDGKYEIDADTCVSCGACAEACPVGAPQEA